MKILKVALTLLLLLLMLSCSITTKPEKECGLPTFAPPPGGYTSSSTSSTISMNIQIFSDTPGATIRYTTDGSDPTASSDRYNGPFSISFSYTTTKVVRAIAIKDGYNTSRIATGSYRRLHYK